MAEFLREASAVIAPEWLASLLSGFYF